MQISSRKRSWWEPQHQAWVVARGRQGFCLSLNKYGTASNELAGNLLLNPGYHRDITVEFYLVSAFPTILFKNVFFRTAEFLKCLPEWGHFQYEVKIYTLQNSTIQENQKYPSSQDTLLLQKTLAILLPVTTAKEARSNSQRTCHTVLLL